MEPSNANTLSITKVETNSNNNHHHCHHQNNPNGISSSNKKQKRITVEEPCRRSMRIRPISTRCMTRISSLFWLDDCSASSDSCSDDVEEQEDDDDENMNSSTSLSRCINMSNVMNNGIAEKSSLLMHPSNQIDRNMNQNLNGLPIIVNERERLGQSVITSNQDMAFNEKINVDTDAGVKVDNHDVEEKVEIEKTIIQFGKRIKLVRIYEDPNIYTMDNFLNEKELDFFDNYIWEMEKNQAFRKSFIEKGANNRSFDESRTSQFVHFEKCQNKRIADIEKRAAELVGMSIECVEPLQLVRYRAGQFFDDHHDLGVLYDDGSVELPKRSPRRICTLFLYMNDIPVENGGSTRFPLLQSEEKDYLDVQPKRGMAVLWCNIRKDGMPDERLVHSGRPITTTGPLSKCFITKYGVNIWINERNS